MESGIAKQLIDKIYEKRKAAALDLEKQIRECHQAGDQRRINQIIDQLVEMFSNNTNPLHIRNGGLIGLAGTAIALGVDIAPYMEKFIDPVLDCFDDPENRIRYFSAECLYNIAKVSKGEVLVYFNQIFDALSKLAADSELSVKNGAELLDRLLKDIVAESASVYIPLYPETEKIRDEREDPRGVLVSYPDGISDQDHPGRKKAFSLAHFIPLLRERIYVLSPFTRSYLVSWINVLDSVPELELISYLPEFLDGLLHGLTSPSAWIPGQGVKVDYAAIVEILIQQLIGEHDEIQQSTALRWLAEFLVFTPEVMVPFTPRFVPAILPNLALHVPMIQHAAVRTNKLLFGVIQSLPSPVELPRPSATEKPTPRMIRSPTPSATTSKQSTVSSQEVASPADSPTAPTAPLQRQRASVDMSLTPRAPDVIPSTLPQTSGPSRPHSPLSFTSQNHMTASNTLSNPEEADLFDYQATVNELTIQFLSEFEETRVAALKWLIMLHQKAPKKILAMDDGTFPALLKTLSDSSEEVIKHDLQLLAQISSSSEENYFKAFMVNLLGLFSTDRRLLETRGSLIIRQLCLNLNTEKIYRTFAEILEKEDDLEFASVMVQKLNIILITSPELADFRKRLKSLETRLARDEIKWQDLLLHFRTVQAKHEKARRQAMGTDSTSYSDFLDNEKQAEGPGSQPVERVGRPPTVGRAPLRRRVTGETPLNPAMVRGGVLSPLNPRARVGGPLINGTASVQKQRRTTSTTRQ
ncbi:hypothetical protein C0992_007144 [Termitomyces sp. T32_za158]|nr:hypothetical protein C0992_007144 [Termitomyces sp. T32_za158]